IFIIVVTAGGYSTPLRINWINNFLPLLSLGFFLVLSRTLSEGARAIPLYLFAATILLQFHLATVPLVVISAAAVLVRIAAEARAPGRAFPKAVLATKTNKILLAAVAVLWLFPLLYELVYRSNLSILFLRDVAAPVTHPAGFREALAVLAGTFSGLTFG